MDEETGPPGSLSCADGNAAASNVMGLLSKAGRRQIQEPLAPVFEPIREAYPSYISLAARRRTSD